MGQRWVSVQRRRRGQGRAPDPYNLVRVDGQRSVYLPIMKQGGDTNTIQVVDGIRDMIGQLFEIRRVGGRAWCSISRRT